MTVWSPATRFSSRFVESTLVRSALDAAPIAGGGRAGTRVDNWPRAERWRSFATVARKDAYQGNTKICVVKRR